MIEKAALVIERHGIGEGVVDGTGGDFGCWCGKKFTGVNALVDWARHVARALRHAGVLR
jgi:hypothetical protein